MYAHMFVPIEAADNAIKPVRGAIARRPAVPVRPENVQRGGGQTTTQQPGHPATRTYVLTPSYKKKNESRTEYNVYIQIHSIKSIISDIMLVFYETETESLCST